MTVLPDFIKQVHKPTYKYKFTVCTLVTRTQEYLEMLESFRNAGFSEDDTEYIILDNTKTNSADAYTGINMFLQTAEGKYIIICHQDIILYPGSRVLLEQRLDEMDKLDSKWAILGNAGAVDRLYNRLAIKIAYPNGFIDIKGELPQHVCSIDENFMIVKNDANLGLSSDIGGFHLYGLDLCINARNLGFSAYVIDFLLVHKSTGNVDASFHITLKKVKDKYTDLLKGRYINTTIAKFYLSGSKFKNIMFNTRVFRRVIKTAEEIQSKLGWYRSS